MAVSLAQFVKHLTESGLLSADEISAFQQGLPPDKLTRDDAQTFAKELVRQKKLTSYQATAIYQGKPHGLLFGNYVVLDKLGQGGMGMVFKAEHRRMKRLVALKVMSGNAMKSPDAVKRFKREVEAVAKLAHPNIVAAFDADEAKGMHFLVMEYVEGSDLSNVVKKNGPLPLGKAVDYVLQAARGLAAAHAEGVVHRDIKPANLLLDRNGTVKILDMGLARLTDPATANAAEGLTQTGTIMGTVDYMSPEQALHTKYADHRADIYSLGCSLYYLLGARPVYSGDSLMMKLLAHREEPIPPMAALFEGVGQDARNQAAIAQLATVFEKMLAKKPEERQQSMADVIRDLEAVLAGAPVTAAAGAMSAESGNSFQAAAGEDTALENFLREISPAASNPELRTRHQPRSAGETMVSRVGDATQTSLLKSAITRVQRLPPGRRWMIAGGGAALVVLLAVFLWPSGKAPIRPGKAPVSQATRPEKGTEIDRGSSKPSKPPRAEPAPPQRQQLFTSDLSGWKGLAGYWTLKDGLLIGSSRGKPLSHNTFLYSEKKYGDFELKYQIRLVGDKGNTGVQVHSRVIDADKATVGGPQVDAGGEYWGCLYDEAGGGMLQTATAGAMSAVRKDDFNDMMVRCRGRHVTINLNGVVTVDADFPSLVQLPDEGVIAFQIHGGPEMEVQFRNVFLRELPSAEVAPAESGSQDSGWVSLLNGNDITGWTHLDGKPVAWKTGPGYIENVPGSGSIRSVREFGPDYELHAEFWLPLLADKQGQARGNSGIYLNGRHEIQILDNFNNNVPANTGCGALYGVLAPGPDGIKPPETWQTFDVTYYSPRWSAALKPTQPGRLSLVRNGAKVIDDQPFEVPATLAAPTQTPGMTGPIVLQDHGAPVRFRNLKIRPLNAPPSRSTDWKSLFNGKDLAGWKSQGFDGWSVINGVIVGQAQRGGPVGWLMSEREFGDYEFEFEYKIAAGSNSGLFLRAWPEGNVSGGEFVEVQLLDDAAPEFSNVPPNCRTGAVFKYAAPQPVPNAPAGKWNIMLASARGNHVQLTINGVRVLDTDIPALNRPTGRIGLQLYPTRIEFRNLRVREL